MAIIQHKYFNAMKKILAIAAVCLGIVACGNKNVKVTDPETDLTKLSEAVKDGDTEKAVEVATTYINAYASALAGKVITQEQFDAFVAAIPAKANVPLETVKGIVETAVAAVKGTADNAVDAAEGVANDAKDAVEGAVEGAVNEAAQAVDDAKDAADAAAQKAVDDANAAVQKAASDVNSAVNSAAAEANKQVNAAAAEAAKALKK